MPVVQHDVLERIAFDVFSAASMPEDEAKIVASHIVTASLLGHDSHGVWYISRYGDMALEGHVDWSRHEVLKESSLFRLIDGQGAHGIVALTRAADIAFEKAETSSIGMAGIRNVTHMGRLGACPTLIAERGMIGMVWTNTGGLAVAPFGSAEKRLRLAPVAYAIPRRSGQPFMLDMTFSVVAGGKIEQKIVRGESIPEGWLISGDGEYVTDGARYRAGEASILALGGLQFGHKGHGLGMMMEMIVGPLTMAGCTDGKERGGGALVTAIDIAAFTDVEAYLDEVEAFAEYVTSAEPLPGVGRVYAPGQLEEQTMERLLEEGIDVPEPTWAEIREIAGRLGVSVPSVS